MKDSQQKYKVLIDNSISAIFFTTPEGTILEVNKAAEEMFGYTLAEFIRLGRKGIIDHADENLPRILSERQAKGKVKSELIGIRKNGEKFPVRLSSVLFTGDDGEQYSCTTMTDISERKKSEQELELMINNTAESFVLLDTNLCVVSFNKQFQNLGKKYLGFEIKKGNSIFDYAQQERKTALKELYARVLKGSTEKATITIPITDSGVKHFELTYSPAKDDYGTTIGVFVTARDITDETESHLAIKETKAELDKIMSSSIDVICTIDVEGNFVKVSSASEKVWGYTPEELVGTKYIKLVHPDDVEKTKISSLEIIAGFDKTNFQNRYIKKDGTLVPIVWSAKWDDTEKIMFCIAKDATEKVKQEAALIASEKLYKNLFDNSPAPMFIFDFETLQIVDCNEETLLKYGYSKEEFLSLTIRDIRPPEDIEKIERVVASEEAYGQIHKNIWRHQKKNGEIMFMDITAHLINYKGRRMSFLMLIDVTEKLKNEELKEFEKRDKEALINSTDDLIWSVSKNFKLIAANQAFLNNIQSQIGITIEPGESLLIEKAFPLEYLDFWKECYSKTLAGISIKEEVKSTSASGDKEVWYDITFNPIYKEKEVVGIACYAKNITDSKKALSVLKDREAKLRSAQEIAKLGYWQREIATENLFWSSEVYKIWNFNKNIKPNFELFTSTIHPDDLEAFMEDQLAAINGEKDMDIEHRIILKDGKIKWVHEKGKLQKDSNSKIIYLAGTVQDVTDRKLTEERLRESIQRYENVTKATSDAIWDWDLVNNVIYRAEGFKTNFGFDLEELNSPDSNWSNYIHPEDRDLAAKSIAEITSSTENHWKHEYRIIQPNGQEVFVQDSAYFIRDENNKVTRIIGALKDISESKYYHNLEILEREILELNALGSIPFNEVIEKYMLGIEKLHVGMLCSMQVRKRKQLFNLASPSLPKSFLKAIEGAEIGNNMGSCGTAAFLRKKVVVTDIPHDIRWINFKALAAKHNLKACWSNPILNSEGKVLATFAAYYRTVKFPTPLEENTIGRACHILQVILESYLKERALTESNIRYENVTKATSDAIWDWDITNNKIFLGETFNHLFGKMDDEMLSDEEKIEKRLHPDEAEQVLGSAREAIKSKDTNWSYEHRFLKSDGEYAFVLNKVLVIRDDNGKAIQIIGALQDITERKEAEEATRKSNERFELIGKAAQDAIWEWDYVTNKGWANLVHQEMFGLTLDNLVPERIEWINRLHPDERERILQSYENAVAAKNDIFYEEYQLKTENKGWISISDRTYIEYDEAGIVKRKIGSMTDITQRKQEEQQLKLMSSVVTYTNDAVMITEAEPFGEPGPKIIYVNDAFTKMTGYAAEEVIGKTPRLLQGPKSDKKELKRLRRAIENWESCDITTINYKKGGEEFWVNFSISPVADEKGWYTHWIAVERDVTIQKTTELQNELIADISIVFNESIKLHETLDKTLRYISDFCGFCLAEAWLSSSDRKIINKVSSHAVTENMKSFQEETKLISAFKSGEGLAGIAAQTKEIQIWSNLSKKKEFTRNKAAAKFGLKTIMAMPLLHNNQVVGVLTFGLDYAIEDHAKYLTLFKTLTNYLGPEIKRKQLEQELNQLFNFAPDVIVIIDMEEGYFKRINPAACELLGYTEEEFYAVPFENFIHPEDREKSTNEAQRLLEVNHTFYFENRYVTKSGKIKWLAWNATYSKQENSIYAVAKDITEKKELEELLQKANELARIGGWELDLQSNTVFWSDITKEIHEVAPDYIPRLKTGLSFYKKGVHRNNIKKIIERGFKTGESWDDEFQIITGKGNERWVRVIGEVELVNGNYSRIYGSFQDIDERKKTQEKIKSSEERRKLIMNAALDAIICIDKKGMITFWNPQADEIFGWSESEVMGKELSKIIIPENYRAMHDIGMKNYLKTGKGNALNVLLQLSAIRKGGEEFPIELTVLPIQQDGEEFFCAFIRDISQRKIYESRLIELNESLKKQKAELVVSNQELEQFAYIASHDLQEPLRMVTSFLTLLNKKYGNNFDETATLYVDFAIDGAKRMRQLILDLLEYSRVGRTEEITESIDLNTLIEEIKILHRKQIEELNANIITEQSLPEVKCYKSPLLQLFQNLISNALKYSRKEVTPIVKISFTSFDDHWCFAVEDNGIGIHKDYFDKIFVIFQRLHNKDEYVGTGMGLAVTKKIVESLGGKIWLESTLGVGSKFYFTIPKKIV
ncbi:PAS domain S-box protein [Flavobacterium sp. 102]|uniref:PAS domain S-box protein n=1 Tax=Flavobacterium sp. 102 TaxID=2135623 RepID=UPI000EABDEFC|nr:PAS domain S-box protein [Flavobacterium sp. 102]RKS03156.1 PAS domain S-box-containing protein [Flavobacterium sp. 102]